MKRIITILLSVVFLAISVSLVAQKQQRTRTIPGEKARQVIENAIPLEPSEYGTRDGGFLVYSENFDNTGGALPSGWSVFNSSTSCVWAVDATPNPPGFHSPDYSLNYNNGVNYDCGNNFGYATSPLIEVSGKNYNITFWWNLLNECGFGTCPWDELYVTVYDESDNFIVSYNLVATNSTWAYADMNLSNTTSADKIYIEFSFLTYDELANNYHGPFIDDLEVYITTADIPLSDWAIVIGIILIVTATVIRFRRTA